MYLSNKPTVNTFNLILVLVILGLKPVGTHWCSHSCWPQLCVLHCSVGTVNANSVDKLRHTRSVAYSVELVLLNKHQISGGGAYLHYYPVNVHVIIIIIIINHAEIRVTLSH